MKKKEKRKNERNKKEKKEKEKEKEKKGKKKQNTVNAYIDIKAFHTHRNNHKCYKIMHILITNVS